MFALLLPWSFEALSTPFHGSLTSLSIVIFTNPSGHFGSYSLPEPRSCQDSIRFPLPPCSLALLAVRVSLPLFIHTSLLASFVVFCFVLFLVGLIDLSRSHSLPFFSLSHVYLSFFASLNLSLRHLMYYIVRLLHFFSSVCKADYIYSLSIVSHKQCHILRIVDECDLILLILLKDNLLLRLPSSHTISVLISAVIYILLRLLGNSSSILDLSLVVCSQ